MKPTIDELLPLQALHLQPVLVAAGAVGEVGALGDDPLQADCRPGGRTPRRPPRRGRPSGSASPLAGEELGERRLAVEERRAAQVVAVEVEQVEGEVDEVVAGGLGQRVLERLEAGGAVGLQHHHLAVEDRLLARAALRGLAGHRGEAVGPVLAVAGDQPGLAVVGSRRARGSRRT